MDGFISLDSGANRLDEEFDVFTLLSDDHTDSKPPPPPPNFSPSKCSATPTSGMESSSDFPPPASTQITNPEKKKVNIVYPRCKRILTRPPFLTSVTPPPHPSTPSVTALLEEDSQVCDKKDVKKAEAKRAVEDVPSTKVKKIKELPLEKLMSLEDVPEQLKVSSNQAVPPGANDGSNETIKRLQHKLNQSENEREHLQTYITKLQSKISCLPRKPLCRAIGVQTVPQGVKCPTCSSYTQPETLLKSFGSDFAYDKINGVFTQVSTGFEYDPYTQLYRCRDNGVKYYWDSTNSVYHYHSKGDHEKVGNVVEAEDEEDEEEGEVKDDNEGDLEEAAKEAMNDNGIKFIPSMNMYFHSSTGLHYCQSSGLYYDSKMSVFYTLSEGTYRYHSAAKSDDTTKSYAKSSIRAIVKETACHKVRTGMLFVFTCMGGTIGREGKLAAVFPEMLVSKRHATISYCTGRYFISDEGTMNGTYLNGTRLSPQKVASERFELSHLDEVKIGSTVLQLHIHLNNATCKWCEPGLNNEVDVTLGAMPSKRPNSSATISTAATFYRHADASDRRRQQQWKH